MVDATLSISASKPVLATAPPASPLFGRQLLSELNPLQYLPVVGTIYRATTGDTIPQTARIAGSLVLSALTGGPVGVAINVGSTLLEQLTGFDPESIGQRLLVDIGIGDASGQSGHAEAAARHGSPALPQAPVLQLAASAAAPLAAAPSAAAASTDSAASALPNASTSSAKGWTSNQLAAYGITRSAGGMLTRGQLSGADVLNTLELAQLASDADRGAVAAT